jgi:ubiquinol-cytochrome c reductase cytochrome b subunit
MYVLPYGQMSLWGIVLPQMHNLYIILSTLVFIFIANIKANDITRTRGTARIGPHNRDILSIIFGSLLGDGHAEKRISGIGTRISFFQEDIHVEYLLYLHKILAEYGYCNPKIPVIRQRLGLKGKLRKVVRFSTWTYTSFNWIHEMWYKDGRKVLPICIHEYLTPLALAIWIMDDGSKVGKGLKLSTNNFTKHECLTLVSVLEKNFNIKSTVQSAGSRDSYIIYIWKDSLNKVRNIVLPYMVPAMKYKIY